MDEPLIVKAIHRYHPDWQPPVDTGKTWIKALCPFHGDGVASAGISYEYNAFRCLGCGFGGSAQTIIQKKEGVNYAEAERISEELSPGSNAAVQREPPRKPRRRLFGEPGTGGPESPPVVPTGIRGRPLPWA